MALAELTCPAIEYFVQSDEDEDEDAGPVERMLMSTDGWITRLLEAFASESMKVTKLSQVVVHPRHSGCPELEMDGTETLLHRSILLSGRTSQLNWLHAEALIAPERLPEV